MNNRHRAGYILLEVVLAVVIVAVGLGVLMDCLGRCLAAARSIQTYSVAEMLLANKSGEFRIERANDLLDQEGLFEEYPGFTWRRWFEPTETQGLWRQILTVSWEERGQTVTDSLVEYRYLPRKQR